MTKKRYFKGIALFVACAAAAVLLNIIGRDLTPGNMTTSADFLKAGELDRVYDVKCPLDIETGKTLDLFIPAYITCEEGTAKAMAALFGDFSPWWETEESFLFENDSETLTVHKRISLIEYRTSTRNNAGDVITAEEAVATARKFLTDRMIQLNCDSVETIINNRGYAISFIDKLNGYDNYGFPSTIKVDTHGNVYDMKYYYFNFDNFETCAVMSMRDAYYGLPLDFSYPDTGEKQVELTGCELVYIYENSIVQPAYMFTGEMIGQDKSFTCYVKAALYN